MTTFETAEQYEAFIAARAETIRRRIMAAVEQATREVFDDEKIAAKSRGVDFEQGVARIGFRDGIGFEIRVVEAYRPEAGS